jgi:hypothetical protein
MSVEPDGRPAPRGLALLAGLAAWLVYVTTAGGTLATSDAVAMFAQADAIVTRGEMDVGPADSSEAWRGVNGRYYLPFGIAQPLYDIPFLVAGRALSRHLPVALGDPDALPKAAVAMATTIPSAFTVALGFLLAWRLSADRRASLLAAAALGFGTLVWPYSKFGFNAPLAAAALTGGVYGIGVGAHAEGRRLLAAGGAALGIAWLTRHELALAIVPAMVWLWWRVHRQPDRLARMSAALAGIAMAGAIWMTLNALHFGHPFWTGHQPDVTFRGIAAFLISPSGALLLYAPAALAGVILVSLAVQGAPLARLLAAVTLVLAAFYGSLDDWLGTRSYGPRYLVPVLPLLVAPLAVWWSRARRRAARFALAALVAVGIAVQIPAVLVDFAAAGIAAEQPPQRLRRDEWQWAPVWLNTRFALAAVPANVRYVAGVEPLPAAEGSDLAERLRFSLNFWWLYLFYLGVLPLWGAAAAAMAPLCLAAALGLEAFRRAGPASTEAPRPALADPVSHRGRSNRVSLD